MKTKKIMNLYFSIGGETEKIAKHFHNRLDTELVDLTNPVNRNGSGSISGDFGIVSIPVFGHNIPLPLRNYLGQTNLKYVVVNITYGGYSYGNILHKIKQSLPSSQIIGYSITPVKHSYTNQGPEIDFEKYQPLIEKIQNSVTSPISIPKKFDIMPSFLEKPLTNLNYRLRYEPQKCIHCGLCKSKCPTTSITGDIILPDSCIRCGLCVSACKPKAITGRKSIFLKIYFRTKQRTSVIIR